MAGLTAEEHWHWQKMLVTAYDGPCDICCPGGDGHTATGKNLNHGYRPGIAADPRAIPYHTWLRVPGYGIAEVDDTGGGMRQDWARGVVHIDVRLPTHEQARQFGRHWMWVQVWDN